MGVVKCFDVHRRAFHAYPADNGHDLQINWRLGFRMSVGRVEANHINARRLQQGDVPADDPFVVTRVIPVLRLAPIPRSPVAAHHPERIAGPRIVRIGVTAQTQNLLGVVARAIGAEAVCRMPQGNRRFQSAGSCAANRTPRVPAATGSTHRSPPTCPASSPPSALRW